MQTKLYDLRKNVLHMNQDELAKYIGISTKAYRDKELSRNQFTQDEMFKISALFKMPIEKIFLPRKYQNGTKKEKKYE